MKERLLGAFIVFIYAALMYLSPKPVYIGMVYLLGVLSVLELFKISSLEFLSTLSVFVFSLFFFSLTDGISLISKFQSFFSSYALSLYSHKLLSSLLLIFPVFSFTLLSSYSLILTGNVSRSVLTALSFFIYLSFGIISIAELTKGLFLLLLSVVWSTDTFAYLTGKFFGRRKLVPLLSPKKTVEGALGGSFFGTLISYFVAVKLSFLPPGILTAVFLFFLTVVSQIGDLIESSLKRSFNVKDSGNLIPGHGGVFDRIDSSLAVAPFLCVLNLVR
jgi:phosphatidate cytidylyltransferase